MEPYILQLRPLSHTILICNLTKPLLKRKYTTKNTKFTKAIEQIYK